MADLPTGTVAFLMTDIEGSTRLVRDLGPAFPALLGDHFRLLGDAIAAAGGTLVSSEGDSVFAVFPSVRQAVLAAVAGQRALADHAWPGGVRVRVRMGVHAGEAVFGGRDYTGLEVHRTARIMAAGHGGQILLSAAARALAGTFDDGIAFRDAGIHQLRDMPAPDELVQLVASGVDATFPPLRTQRMTVPTNLPTPLTRFVGRSAEVLTATGLLADTRLLTLTGPGGTGKTRLAIEVARNCLDQFTDGVWFVALDVVRDPALVIPALARVLGVGDSPGRSPVAAVAARLADRRSLVVLDNLEQVIESAAEIAALLAAAPGLTMLTTSREPLAIAGERVYAVPPLALPDEPGRPSASALAANDCVALFVERARAARADFDLTDANAPTIAAICRRLDGLPLALELAAARINVIGPEQILARMDHRLSLLASTRRDLTDRQRTLRGAIEWSYDLLTDAERTFFRRFGVFSGGADFEAIQAVVDPDGELGDALELTAALVDRSLLRAQQTAGTSRYEMLETLREFALDRLAATADEAATVGRRHSAYFADLADVSEQVLVDPQRDAILDRLDREQANFQAAVAFGFTSGELDDAIRIAVALRDYWHARAYLLAGRRLLARLADATADEHGSPRRVRLLLAASEISSWNAEYGDAQRFAREALTTAEAGGDPATLAAAHQGLGWATFMADPVSARASFERSIELAREPRDLGVLRGALQGLAITLMRQGDWQAAEPAVDRAVEVAEEMGDRYINAFNLVTRSFLENRRGDRAAARIDLRRALDEAHGAGSLVGVALVADVIAAELLEHGDRMAGATLAVAATRLREDLGGAPTTALAGLPEPLDVARRLLPPEDFAKADAAGRGMGLEATVAAARAHLD